MEKRAINKVFAVFAGSAAIAAAFLATGPEARAAAGVSVSADAQIGGAASATATASTSARLYERRVELQERAAEIKTDLREKGEAWREGRAELRADMGARLEAYREAAAERLAERRTTVKARMEAWKKGVATRQEEARKRLGAEAKARVENVLNAITNRFDAILGHLAGVSARLEARITELENEGHDLSESARLLADADAKLKVAQDDVAEVKAHVKAELSATTSRETLKGYVNAAKESVKETHKAYVDVTQSIRAEMKAGTEADAKLQATTTSS